MAKSNIALHNPPGPTKESRMMKIPYGNHFPGHITSICKLNAVVNSIQEKLTKQQLKLFKDDIFGKIVQAAVSYLVIIVKEKVPQ